MIKIDKLIDLRYLSWSKTRQSSGTAGSYLKSYSFDNGKKVYYKLSYFDDIEGIFGYESFNEIIANKLLTILEYNHLEYNLLYAKVSIKNKEYDTYLNSSYDFKKNDETKLTLENFYSYNKYDDEDIISFCKRYNFIDEIYHMLIIDYLIMNRDRHGANIEVLYNSKTKKYKLAPLFDHGLSLLSPSYKDEEIINYNIQENKKVNSFIGTSSLEENIKIVPKEAFKYVSINFDNIFLDITTKDNYIYMEKAKKILIRRWTELENIFNTK